MRRRHLLLVALAAVLLVGCSGDGDEQATTTDTSGEVSAARVYFLLDENVWPVARSVSAGDDAENEIVEELSAGPTAQEQEIGLVSSYPEGVTDVSVADDVATVELDEALTTEQLAQLVYTLTQPALDVESVDVDGTRYTRADFEEQTPSVLVESPLAFEASDAPITATGTANTFEATFHYELVDSEGRVIDENFVTATSGTGTRGTFEFTTADVDDPFALVVFERSAKDGSRMREIRIPLTQAS